MPLTDDWLVFKNFADFQLEPSKETFRSCLCTPHLYNKYACIFGLTGSVGGEAERAYIAKTFQAVPYVVPQFLTTCEHTTKEDATNLGVRILPTRAAMLAEVARAACEHHRKVPVLVITRGGENDELQRVCRALVSRLARHVEVATAEPQPAVSPEDWERLARLSKLASEHEPTAAPLPPPSPSTSPHPPPQPPSPGQKASPARGVVRAADRARWPLRVPTHGSSPASAATSPTPLAPPASAASPLASPPSRRQPVPVPTHASPPAAATPARPKTGLGALCSSSTSHVLDRIQLLQARNAEGESMIEQCGAIVDLATKRCYTKERDSYFAMTVTDWLGGRNPNPTPTPQPLTPNIPNTNPNPNPEP